MAEKTQKNVCYIRRGRHIRGPYPIGQAQKFLLLGRIKPDDEISFDQQHWSLIRLVPSMHPAQWRDAQSSQGKMRLQMAIRREDERRSERRTEGNAKTHADQRGRNERRKPEVASVVLHRTEKTDRMKKERMRKERAKWPLLLVLLLIGGVISWVSLVRLKATKVADEPQCDLPARANINWVGCRIDQNLVDANLEGALLNTVKFTRMDLKGALLRNAKAEYADFSYADLSHAVLQNGHFKGANFRHADLSYVVFDQADLSYADLTGANLGGVSLLEVNLSHTIWYDGRLCVPGSIGRCLVRNAQ